MTSLLASPAGGPLSGRVSVPGDKSISHRGVLFAAMSAGSCRLTGVLDSADVRSTIEAVRALGAVVLATGRRDGGLDLEVTGWGATGPVRPSGPIDCGNSGTTARLLMGILAGWDVEVSLIGDESLSRRPMSRVMEPLARMGASFSPAAGGTLPLRVCGGRLRAIRYEMPVASAQVKSAILLAGLRAAGRTVVIEPAPSRDHTERLLPGFGVGVGRDAGERACWVDGPARILPSDLSVPGDPSSAAFLAVAALMVPGSAIVLDGVALNPTRTGFVAVLQEMGARLTTSVDRASGAEPVGSISATYSSSLHGVTVAADRIAGLVDEVVILALAATAATGITRFEGVGELRVKESDRLQAVQEGLSALGATVRSGQDWLEVEGPVRLHGGRSDSLGDHRLAMTWAVAGLVARGPVTVERWDAVDVSYPRFAHDLAQLQDGSRVG